MSAFHFEHHPFWEFSLKVYGNEGVPAAWIALQERRGIDVNLLLFCAWVGESGRGALSESNLDAASAATVAWNGDIVCAIRAVRDCLKGGMPPIPKERSDILRKMILEIEVKCEHVEQIALTEAVPLPVEPGRSLGQRGVDAVTNVAAYFRRHGFKPDGEDAEQVAVVLDPAFPDVGRAALESNFRTASAA